MDDRLAQVILVAKGVEALGALGEAGGDDHAFLGVQGALRLDALMALTLQMVH